MMVKHVSITYALSSVIVVHLLTYMLSVLHPAFSFEEDTHMKLRPSKLKSDTNNLNLSNVELNPFCHLLALLEAHHILHISRIRVYKESFFLIIMVKISVNVLYSSSNISKNCNTKRYYWYIMIF
jgi:hypothetical protein